MDTLVEFEWLAESSYRVLVGRQRAGFLVKGIGLGKFMFIPDVHTMWSAMVIRIVADKLDELNSGK